MMMTSLLPLLAVLVPAALTIDTVKELKPAKYLGRWYQMYTSTIVAKTFEKGAQCVTADYGLNPNGTVSVLNQETVDKPDGKLKVIHGYAELTNVTGQLSVLLQTVPFAAPYWVVQLGPETFGNGSLYEYSVVTDSITASLFVLARDVDAFRKNYQSDVLAFLKKEGFSRFYNTPVETVQSADCKYGPVPA